MEKRPKPGYFVPGKWHYGRRYKSSLSPIQRLRLISRRYWQTLKLHSSSVPSVHIFQHLLNRRPNIGLFAHRSGGEGFGFFSRLAGALNQHLKSV